MIATLADRLNAATAAESRSAMIQNVQTAQRLLADILLPDLPALESFEIGGDRL
jgi:hypothetical protein